MGQRFIYHGMLAAIAQSQLSCEDLVLGHSLAHTINSLNEAHFTRLSARQTNTWQPTKLVHC